jgi:hypothetical protein
MFGKNTMLRLETRTDPSELMRQAPITIEFYLAKAVEGIDRAVGPGYAAQNPELVGAFIRATSIDYAANKMAEAIEGLAWTG